MVGVLNLGYRLSLVTCCHLESAGRDRKQGHRAARASIYSIAIWRENRAENPVARVGIPGILWRRAKARSSRCSQAECWFVWSGRQARKYVGPAGLRNQERGCALPRPNGRGYYLAALRAWCLARIAQARW